MEKSSILKNFFNKKTQDYTYAVAFFFIFSFFIFYVIRPNLISVFEIRSKIDQLNKINSLYREQIDKIIEIQSALEESRDDLVLLKEAIAEKPEVNKVLSDVNVSTEGSKITPERVNIADINLKDKGSTGKLKSFIINMDLKGSFEDTTEFIKKIYDQRRLKLIQELDLTRDEKQSSDSSILKIKLEVEGYYL